MIVSVLDALLGCDGSIEWGYLNSGTHDSQRDGELDHSTVRTIVGLDQELAVLSRR